MSRIEFMSILERKLHMIPKEERDEALAYYNEYFDDAGSDNESAAVASMGDPSEAAAKIIGSYAAKGLSSPRVTSKKSANIIWIIILGIFASPVAMPVALAVVIVIIALLISLFSVLFAFAVSGAACTLAGIAAMVMGISVFIRDMPTGMLFTGAGMVCLAVGILLCAAVYKLSAVSVKGIAKLFANILNRRYNK